MKGGAVGGGVRGGRNLKGETVSYTTGENTRLSCPIVSVVGALLARKFDT